MSVNIVTCRKWQESRIFLKAAVTVQEVLWVEGPGRLPHFVIFQHIVQQRNDHCVLLRRDAWSRETLSHTVNLWNVFP